MAVAPFSEKYWSEIETVSAAEARAVQNERLREQVDHLAANSAFYREKFARHRIDPARIRSVDDLAGLPFTEKQELRDSLAATPPLGSHVGVDSAEIVQIQASSGTTGSPSYVGLTASDIVTWSELGARALYANGFRPGDRLLHAFGMSKGFVGGLPIVQIMQYMGIVDIPIGAEAGAERLLRIQADQRPNALIGTPHFLAHLAEQAPKIVGRPAHELGVRAISVGGEPGGGLPAVREKLESLWGATSREMLGGTDIACTYWGECEAADGMHFLSPDLMIAELIDPESGARIEPVEGAQGELVYTALRRRASALLRFRTRDHVVVTGTDCPCGRTGFKVRCIGRTDDMLIVRGINLFPSAVKQLVAELAPATTGEMRIRVDFEGHSTQRPLPLVVEHSAGMGSEAQSDLRATIEQRVRSALNVKTVVELVPDGTLKRPDHVKVSLIERVAP
ncbi:phenylacetate--CoA ligase family protein [Streptomyces cinereoruber]|uniref:Phenylacetate--CoA ligase family protein n=1 Tax=Streptomyces cinereoruber TaxID=67260 RepID=A0ABX6BN44_9ACTN|nr:AMP-binding protein [Streptomyces cinereoruber]MBB4158229.1 phenylacetate-CoA ligase [Streptomyces cinereoruber]MBY8819237.1 AMP-binding protein [Streptomyces cinereoruber]NIH63362.1 phenylacetate-CoA ligase [Streptomyces cinereoruber]QEV36019.1 phenylacetate--CoA ligase family protein [Streptomyces cinereoruber]